MSYYPLEPFSTHRFCLCKAWTNIIVFMITEPYSYTTCSLFLSLGICVCVSEIWDLIVTNTRV
jgi:hypothetical protein